MLTTLRLVMKKMFFETQKNNKSRIKLKIGDGVNLM